MAPIQYIVDANCCEPYGIRCCWVVPDGVRHVTFEVWGGGGGGGSGGNQCNCCQTGEPGLGGAYARKSVNVTPGDYYWVCAGNGGMAHDHPQSGVPVSNCCNGISGGASYVIGVGLTNFCSEGGRGGRSDLGVQCYYWCGCNGYSSATPGISATAYGYDYHAHSNGYSMSYTQEESPYHHQKRAGNGAGPYGGGGGWNYSGGAYCAFTTYPGAENWRPSATLTETLWHGRIPGGGGAPYHNSHTCMCYNGAKSGKGAPGAVKITY